jgi:hypothetical protein
MTLFARLAQRTRERGALACRTLNRLGPQAGEIPCRARRPPFAPNAPASNGRRRVDGRLPPHARTKGRVWRRARAGGVPHHPAHGLGVLRPSCCFCVLSRRSAPLLAGRHNPELVDECVRAEGAVGHRSRQELWPAGVRRALARGGQPGRVPGRLL